MGSGNTKTVVVKQVDVQDSLNHPDRPYLYCTKVLNEETAVPYELVETKQYYYIALELPGVTSIKQVRVKCIVTDTGYEVCIVGTKPSAVEPPPVVVEAKEKEKNQCTRRLGDVSWNAVVCGVFDEQPECNYHEGIFKMRLKKRENRTEAIDFVDF